MQSIKNTTCEAKTEILAPSVLAPLLITELLLGLPGNLMALYIFCCQLQSWKPIILFLFNLILADFLLLVSMPFRIDAYLRTESWVFGDAWCRINLFMLAVNRSASISFMTAVAVNRYFKVVHPHNKINYISSRQAGGITCFIWVVVISLRVPLLTNNLIVMKENISFCRSFGGEITYSFGIKLHHAVFIAEFFLPLLVLLFCSIKISCILQQRQMDKEKKVRQAIRTVLVIVGIFIFCFLPGVATGLTALYLKSRNEYCEAYKVVSKMFVLSIGFTYMNSALDPVIYCFSSSIFRNVLKKSINRVGLVQFELSRRASTAAGSDY